MTEGAALDPTEHSHWRPLRLRAASVVRTTVGADARSKKVTLTAKASGIVDRLAAEWRATEAAVAE
jgi:hypothetical protein